MANLSAVGKLLKKNGVSLDIISFGNEEDNSPAIVQLLAAAGGLDATAAEQNIYEALLQPGCECHLSVVKVGENLTEALMTSPILLGEDGTVPGQFGMDEDMDPELAMALKLSLEEEKGRQQKERSSSQGGEDASSAIKANDDNNEMAIDEDDEETMLARAIAMSMETAAQEKNPSEQSKPH